MTRLVPFQRCDRCGGLLVPPIIHAPVKPDAGQERSSKPAPDYVCDDCSEPYRWEGDPPRLVASNGDDEAP